MKSIMAETERNAFPQTPPKDGSLAKWTPRTPLRPERMPSTSGSPVSSPSKKVDLRVMTPAITQESSIIVKPDTTSSGLSMSRPQGVGPTLGIPKPLSQSPPGPHVFSLPTHAPQPRTRAQSGQPIIPARMGPSSPSIRRASLAPSFRIVLTVKLRLY